MKKAQMSIYLIFNTFKVHAGNLTDLNLSNWDKKSVDERCFLSNSENIKISSHKNLNRIPKDETERNKLQIENTLKLHSNQIFLGMVTMQYRAKIVNNF